MLFFVFNKIFEVFEGIVYMLLYRMEVNNNLNFIFKFLKLKGNKDIDVKLFYILLI